MLVIKSNMAGPYHIDNNIPCQDSFAIENINTGIYIVSVADGLGSELYSDVGSSVASKTAVEFVANNISCNMSFVEIKKVMNNAFVNAYKAVLTQAAKDGNDPDEYDTTLCLAVYDGERLFYGQAGDSGIVVLLENGEYLRVTSQQRDEEGYVFPLCSGPNKWDFGEVEGPVSAVMLMTDGVFEQICPPLMRNSIVDVNIPLAKRFLDRFECSEADVTELEEALYDYLEHYPRYLLDDDKTMVVLINSERKPTQKEDSYYAIPDWEALSNEARTRVAESDDYKAEADNHASYVDAVLEKADAEDRSELEAELKSTKPSDVEEVTTNSNIKTTKMESCKKKQTSGIRSKQKL